MTRRGLRNVGLGLLVFALFTGWPQAWQRPQSSQERAQEQPFPAGSPFALLPGFKIERVTPADKTESLIVVTFDSLGRPVVSQSSSGNGSSPRVLLDANGDGIFEGEKIVSDKLNTCHGLFYDGRTLYANCRGVVAGDPPPDAPPAAGPAQAQGGAQPPGGGRGNQGPTIGIPGFYKLEDTNGDDVMDTIERIQRYTSNGMGDHGPHAIRRGPDGSIMFLVGNNTYVGAAPVNDDAVDKAASPNWNNSKERQFLPQFNDPRFGNSTRIGVHATVWRLLPNNKFALFYSGMRNPYDFAYNLAGEAFVFDSDMEWDVNAPWYREVRTAHMIPGGDAGYRNGTGKIPGRVLRHAARAPAPAPRVPGRRRGLSELRVSAVFLRQPVRGGLVARAAALHGADAERRDVYGTRGSRRVRARRADADHRPRSRTRRQHLPDDGRRGRTGWALQGQLDRCEAAAARHDGRPRHRAAAAADLELGMGGDRASQDVDGRVVRHRAREAGANGDARHRAIAPAPCWSCSAMGRHRARSCWRRSARIATPACGRRRCTSPACRRAPGQRRSRPRRSRTRRRSSSAARPKRSCARG